MKLLENKVALVTASTRGIGKAIVKVFAENGAKVYLAVRNLELGEQVAKELGAAGVVHFDTLYPETFEGCVKDLLKKEGRIDVLVNNYGGTDVAKDIDIVNGDTEAMARVININLTVAMSTAKAAIPAMIAQGGGSIVNISSSQSLRPDINRPAYGMAKTAINSLTQNIACEFGKNNIRCNAVLPGLTLTDAVAKSMPGYWLDMYNYVIPMARPSKPEDQANAVLFFASDLSSHVSGQLLAVDGACSTTNPIYGLYPFMKPPAKD
ncbi:MAG: SDR family oxidoreductase [Oscillospiraceae bacterium]